MYAFAVNDSTSTASTSHWTSLRFIHVLVQQPVAKGLSIRLWPRIFAAAGATDAGQVATGTARAQHPGDTGCRSCRSCRSCQNWKHLKPGELAICHRFVNWVAGHSWSRWPGNILKHRETSWKSRMIQDSPGFSDGFVPRATDFTWRIASHQPCLAFMVFMGWLRWTQRILWSDIVRLART